MRAKTYPPDAKLRIRSLRAYVSVSLSNRVSASEGRLRDIFAWARDNTESFSVVIGDYFHRHNLEDLVGMTESVAKEEATSAGRIHARLIRDTLDAAQMPDIAIHLASDLCAQPSFADRVKDFEKLADKNDAFRGLIDVGTNEFLRRFAPARLHSELARRHSQLYQLEELAMFEHLSGRGYSANVYPGAHLPVMKQLVAGALPGLLPVLASVSLVELRFGRTT